MRVGVPDREEALANVAKHAGAARTRVDVRHDHDTVTVTVVNDPAPPGHVSPGGTGLGLVGICERAALRRTLGQHTDLAVAGTAADGAHAVASAAELRPDVVLMDVRMPGMTGIEACRRIVAAAPEARVLMLTTFDHDEYVHDALRAGAAGFVLKNAATARLVDAVREVAAGGSVLAPTVTRRLVDTVTTLPPAMLRPPAPDVLTPRERAVLRLLAMGLSNRAIARRLTLSESSVKSTVNRILTRLGLENRVQAALLAHQYLSGPP